MNSPLLDALSDRVLIWDGAMGTQLQAAQLSDADFVIPADSPVPAVREARQRLGDSVLEGCNELLNLTRPDVVEAIHRRYFEAGADLIETNTFGGSTIVLDEYAIPDLLFEISLQAARIARRAADAVSTQEKPRFVIGAIGPGTKLPSLGQTTFDEVRASYQTAFTALIEGGSDGLLLETMQDLLLVKAGIVAATRAMADAGRNLPLIVQVTMEQTGTMLMGSEMGAALNMIEAYPQVVAFGLNCATGPVEMIQHVRFLSQFSTRPISVLPNAGLPEMEGGKAVYRLTPAELAHHHSHFVNDLGATMVGGCCGTTPAHIEAVAEALSGTQHSGNAYWQKKRTLYPGFDFKLDSEVKAEGLALVGCSSLFQFQPYRQDASFLIVGERLNANGSKAFRDMLAAENWEGLLELAREQEAEGCHVLDVCTAFVGRDEARDLSTLCQGLNRQVTIPIMIDSTELDATEAALKTLAGKCIINSINFEDGGERLEKVLRLCQTYGAAVVALTIDEDGMAKTAAKKIEIAERLLAATRAAGLPDHDVFVDCLTFTLGSGDEEFRQAGIETINAIRELHLRHPRVNSLLGVSNISFGLKPAARMALNSVFLHECREAGLTSAIVHFSKILPETRIGEDVWKVANDLVFDKREFAEAK